jgi:hypothetical protein
VSFTNGNTDKAIDMYNMLIYDNFAREISQNGADSVSTRGPWHGNGRLNSGKLKHTEYSATEIRDIYSVMTLREKNQWANITLQLDSNQEIQQVVIHNRRQGTASDPSIYTEYMGFTLDIWKNGLKISNNMIYSLSRPKILIIPIFVNTFSSFLILAEIQLYGID